MLYILPNFRSVLGPLQELRRQLREGIPLLGDAQEARHTMNIYIYIYIERYNVCIYIYMIVLVLVLIIGIVIGIGNR